MTTHIRATITDKRSDQRSVQVVDLTIDSDFDSDDDEPVSSRTPAVNSKVASVSLPLSSRAHTASTPATRPSTTPVALPGSIPRLEPTPSASAHSNGTHTLLRETPASSSRQFTVKTSADMGGTASLSKSYTKAQTVTAGISEVSKDAEESVKRLRLSLPV